jgi:hypothetical protein
MPFHFEYKDYIMLQKLEEDIDEELFHCIEMN